MRFRRNPQLLENGKPDEALKKALYYRDLFGKDKDGEPCFYLEIQDHGTLSEKDINAKIIDISRKTGIPLVATNDVHYLDREDYAAHDILLCIGAAKTRADENSKRYYGNQFYFKTGDEMAALFADYPDAIENTVRIARRCNVDITGVPTEELPGFLPDFDIPPGFNGADAYLRHLTAEGLALRYAEEKAGGGTEWYNILKRAEYELDTIIKKNCSNYFLIVADFVKWARELKALSVNSQRPGHLPDPINREGLNRLIRDIGPCILPLKSFLAEEMESAENTDDEKTAFKKAYS